MSIVVRSTTIPAVRVDTDIGTECVRVAGYPGVVRGHYALACDTGGANTSNLGGGVMFELQWQSTTSALVLLEFTWHALCTSFTTAGTGFLGVKLCRHVRPIAPTSGVLVSTTGARVRQSYPESNVTRVTRIGSGAGGAIGINVDNSTIEHGINFDPWTPATTSQESIASTIYSCNQLGASAVARYEYAENCEGCSPIVLTSGMAIHGQIAASTGAGVAGHVYTFGMRWLEIDLP